MATYVGKTNNAKEIEYINYVMQLSGAPNRTFVRMAILYYCDHLMQRARELRQQEVQAILERQEQAEREATDESTDSNPDRDTSEPGAVLPIDNSALADPQSGVANS